MSSLSKHNTCHFNGPETPCVVLLLLYNMPARSKDLFQDCSYCLRVSIPVIMHCISERHNFGLFVLFNVSLWFELAGLILLYLTLIMFFRCQQDTCLATGGQIPLQSGVEVRDKTSIITWVNHPVPLQIWLNAKIIERVTANQLLEQPDGRLAFQRDLTEDEKSPGLKVVRIFALQEDQGEYDIGFR